MEKRVWCPHADKDDFTDCKHIGVEETCKAGDSPCLREAEDVNRDRPYDRQDPWQFKPEVSPTHMNF